MDDLEQTNYPDPIRYAQCVKDIGILLQKAGHIFQMMEREQRRKDGFTGSQSFFLALLADKGEWSMGEIAREMNLEKSSLTRLAGTLIRSQLVETRTDERDKRIQLLRLTDRGRVTADSVRTSRREYYETLISLLPRGHVREVMDSAEILVNALAACRS